MTKDTLLAPGAATTHTHALSRSADPLTAPNLTGSTWSMNGKGFVGGLQVISVRHNGKFEGTLFSNHSFRSSLISGTWNKSSKHITFTRHLPSGATQTYKGSLVNNPSTQLLTFAGTFTQSNITHQSRTEFEWFAQFQGVVM